MNVKFPFVDVPAEAKVVWKAAGFVAQGSNEAVCPHFGVGLAFHFLRAFSQLQRAVRNDVDFRTMDVHKFSILNRAHLEMIVTLEELVLRQ